MTKVVGIHLSAAQVMWKAHGLVPNRVRTVALLKDREFTAKLHDVIEIRYNTTLPPERGFGVDEVMIAKTEQGKEGIIHDMLGAGAATLVLQRPGRKAQRLRAPYYLKGLILPGERKNIEPMAARVAPANAQQLHHFVSTSPWVTALLEDELVKAPDKLVGRSDAVLVIDDTALVEQHGHSVGVKHQYRCQLGKQANCQSLESLALARASVPVCASLHLLLLEDWCSDVDQRTAADLPEPIEYRPKWRIALEEIDHVLAAGARFGCVLADAEYGKAAELRHRFGKQRFTIVADAILPTPKAYLADVTLIYPECKAAGRSHERPVPSAASVAAAELIKARLEAFCTISWRIRTKGRLKAEFTARRVGVADSPATASGQHLPGEGARLSCEQWPSGKHKYYLANLPAYTWLKQLAPLIKACWVCEQMHQQLKDELELDHFEDRSWCELQHHPFLCQLAFAFQHLRLGGKRCRHPAHAWTATSVKPARHPLAHPLRTHPCSAPQLAQSATRQALSPFMKVAG